MHEVDGFIEADYRFEILGECSLSTNTWEWADQFLLTKGIMWPMYTLTIEDYAGWTQRPLEWDEFEEYLMYYVDRYKRETGKDFLKRIRAKINFKK